MQDYITERIRVVEPRLVDLMNSEGKGAIENAVGQYEDRAVLFRKDSLGPYGSALNDHMLTSIKHSLVDKCRAELNEEYALVQQNTLAETKGLLKLSVGR